MTAPSHDRESRVYRLLLLALAALLGIATIIGVAEASTSTSADRVAPADSAPVYGQS